MFREAVILAPIFVAACVIAVFSLLKRCEGRGRAFGPRSRRWAVLVVALTSVLSVAGAVVLALLGHYLPAAIMSLGVFAPGSLCLGQIREGIPERRSVYSAASTLWLSWLLARMTEGMAEDKLEWCERHVDAAWQADELIKAARYYHKYLSEHLSDENRKRYRINVLFRDVEERLNIVRLIDARASRSRIAAAVGGSRLVKDAKTRYQQHLDDPAWLGGRLEHDARQALERMVAAAYLTDFPRLECYTPAREPRPLREPAEPTGGPRWHP